MHPPTVNSLNGLDFKIRHLEPSDTAALRHLHNEIFPIDYAEDFFSSAVSQNGIVSWAAVTQQSEISAGLPDSTTVFVGQEQLVGFITARVCVTQDIPAADRQLLGLAGKRYDACKIAYLLTLGVVPAFRHRGVASALLDCVERHAREDGCVSLHLHVICYNEAAKQFYRRAGFRLVARLPKFYHIQTGRALYKDVKDYDAYLYMKEVLAELTAPLGGVHAPWPSFMDPLWHLTRCCTPLIWTRKHKIKREDPVEDSKKAMASSRPTPLWLRRLFAS